MSETFVLIHGSWHGGWARQAVICNLSAKGHHAHAPTLAGHGLGVIRAGITHQAVSIPLPLTFNSTALRTSF